MEYYARYEPAGEGSVTITFPDFGWGVSQGDTAEQARQMSEALLETLIQEHIDKGDELPRPGRHPGRKYHLVTLSALKNAKAELYNVFRSSGMRKAELARRLGIPKTNVDRLFDLRHRSRMDQMEAAFAALNKRLKLAVEDAA